MSRTGRSQQENEQDYLASIGMVASSLVETRALLVRVDIPGGWPWTKLRAKLATGPGILGMAPEVFHHQGRRGTKYSQEVIAATQVVERNVRQAVRFTSDKCLSAEYLLGTGKEHKGWSVITGPDHWTRTVLALNWRRCARSTVRVRSLIMESPAPAEWGEAARLRWAIKPIEFPPHLIGQRAKHFLFIKQEVAGSHELRAFILPKMWDGSLPMNERLQPEFYGEKAYRLERRQRKGK